MKDRILQLCKRLNKFSLADIETVSEMDTTKILPVLNELISEKLLLKKQDIYYYQKKNRDLSVKLPLMFQYHSNQDINYIIKSFCADVEAQKIMHIFNFSKHVANNFYQYLRTSLYEKQKTELIKHFEKHPKIGQERIYMTAKVYLYLYDHKLYVSEKLLKGCNLVKHTEAERLEIKNIYLRSFRKVLSRSFAHRFHIHLSEELWKWGKDYKQRYSDICKILFA